LAHKRDISKPNPLYLVLGEPYITELREQIREIAGLLNDEDAVSDDTRR
jgi:hypothetical protein